jgi:hypothetical protein
MGCLPFNKDEVCGSNKLEQMITSFHTSCTCFPPESSNQSICVCYEPVSRGVAATSKVRWPPRNTCGILTAEPELWVITLKLWFGAQNPSPG